MPILTENLTAMDPVFEVYYGKPPEFKKIEKLLVPIIDACINMDMKRVNLNGMSELREIENILTRFFGVGEVSITFIMMMAQAGPAFARPSFFTFFKKDKDNKKLAKKENLFINLTLDAGSIRGLKFTPEELLAIILHEIGHCFDASLFAFLSKISFMSAQTVLQNLITNAIAATFNTKPVVKYTQKKIGKTASPLNSKYDFIRDFVIAINDFVRDIMPLLNVNSIYNIITKIKRASMVRKLKDVSRVINWTKVFIPRNIFGYAGEKFSDSFASSYGYALPLSTGLNKYHETSGSEAIKFLQEDMPVLYVGYDLMNVMVNIVTMITLDPHPNTAARVQNQLNKLKRDIKDPNLRPDIRQELESQINDMQNYINLSMTNLKEAKESKAYISKIWNFMIMKIFKGKLDPRELFEIFYNHEL